MPSALTDAHMAAQRSISARVAAEVAVAWRALDLDDLDGSLRRYLAAALPVLLRNRALSTAAAVAYLREERLRVLGDPGVILAAEEPPALQVVTVARVTSVVAVKRSMTAGATLALAGERAFVLASGDLSRLALAGGRSTVTRSAVAEPRVVGWRRVLSTPSCKFCQLLAGRGAVYREDTVRFRAHGHCDCGAEEVYR